MKNVESLTFQIILKVQHLGKLYSRYICLLHFKKVFPLVIISRKVYSAFEANENWRVHCATSLQTNNFTITSDVPSTESKVTLSIKVRYLEKNKKRGITLWLPACSLCTIIVSYNEHYFTYLYTTMILAYVYWGPLEAKSLC